ncbi:MAG TPA: formate/nitrite transporter family protein [Terriglobales bacterium]|nr:formate/nitrite transporter family protein [Terriglobales bacterium]
MACLEPGSAADPQRLNAREIFEVVVTTGRDELARPLLGIALSALAGGVTIGLSVLAVALAEVMGGGGPGAKLLAAALYPFGYIAVVIGRAQFFTENTLFPVITYLADRRRGRRLLAFWGVVLGGNLVGALLFALLAMRSAALSASTRDAIAAAGAMAAHRPGGEVFWSAVVGGWLMALVAWTVSASQWTSGQILVTWLFTFLIGLGDFAHCIASSAKILAAVLVGQVGVTPYLGWLGLAVAGNIAGGVVIVSLLNFGQVRAGEPS